MRERKKENFMAFPFLVLVLSTEPETSHKQVIDPLLSYSLNIPTLTTGSHCVTQASWL